MLNDKHKPSTYPAGFNPFLPLSFSGVSPGRDFPSEMALATIT